MNDLHHDHIHLDDDRLAGMLLDTLEGDEAREARRHLRRCQRCADELALLERAVGEGRPPELAAAEPATVERTWQAILADLEARPAARPSWRTRLTWWAADTLALPVGGLPAQLVRVAALLALGFGAAWLAAGYGLLPGIGTPTLGTSPESQGPAAAVRAPDRRPAAGASRKLLASEGYAGRLETLLLGLSRNDAGRYDDTVRSASRELLGDSRWYREIASSSGDAVLADLLGRIEIVLLALATAPEGQEARLVDEIRSVIEEDQLLWRLRSVRQSVPAAAFPGATGQGS